MLITVLIIPTAFALAALGYQKVDGTQTSPQQAASGNNMEIQREINELNTQLLSAIEKLHYGKQQHDTDF